MNLKSWTFLIAFYLILLGGGWWVGQWLPESIGPYITPDNGMAVRWAVVVAFVFYVLLSALPFVPGAEIGFGLIMLFGGQIAPLVYLGMVTALALAFLVGRRVPLRLIARGFERLHFNRIRDFVAGLAHLDRAQRLALLTEKAPNRIAPFLMRHRYILLAVIMNVPGNSLIGGGGGIAFIAGLSGMFSYGGYLITILIAVVPLPLFFYLTQ